MKDLPSTSSFSLGKLNTEFVGIPLSKYYHFISSVLNGEFCRYISVKYNKPFVTSLKEAGGKGREGSETTAVLNRILPPRGELYEMIRLYGEELQSGKRRDCLGGRR